jgi:hypothetical protein
MAESELQIAEIKFALMETESEHKGLSTKTQNYIDEFDVLVTRLKLLMGLRDSHRTPDEDRPGYANDIANIEGQLRGLERISQILEYGYKPGTMPANFYVSRTGHAINGLYIISRLAPEPHQAAVAAAETNLFIRILIGSADYQHFAFNHERDSGLNLEDPVIIGYSPRIFNHNIVLSTTDRQNASSNKVFHGLQHQGYPGVDIGNAEGFTIYSPELTLQKAEQALDITRGEFTPGDLRRMMQVPFEPKGSGS